MEEVGLTILEILKYIIPALVVFATIYFILNKYLQQQYNLEVLKYKQNESKNIIPLKLQAYERCTLFLERIKPQQLIYRLNTAQMNAGELRTAMLIAVQKEYEHNLTQQIYVSEKLWQIITLAKNEVINLISNSKAGNEESSHVLAEEITQSYAGYKFDPVAKAQSAIKKELSILL